MSHARSRIGGKPKRVHMTFAQLLADYGYLAVFIGSLLEGESVLVLAGFASHQGYLSLALTVAIAFVGGTLGDQIFFWLGRAWGQPLLDRIPHSEHRVQRVKDLLQRHHAPVIVGIRFMYGLRIIGPIVIGACEIPPWRFALFNMLGAAVWAPLVAGLGYLFGDALELLPVDLKQFESTVLALIVAVAVAFSLIRRWRSSGGRSR
jgi:membrane protein DedA with SNARE-associated domain